VGEVWFTARNPTPRKRCQWHHRINRNLTCADASSTGITSPKPLVSMPDDEALENITPTARNDPQ
jgi:hypothetical protein